jgi:hypothetical protein
VSGFCNEPKGLRFFLSMLYLLRGRTTFYVGLFFDMVVCDRNIHGNLFCAAFGPFVYFPQLRLSHPRNYCTDVKGLCHETNKFVLRFSKSNQFFFLCADSSKKILLPGYGENKR